MKNYYAVIKRYSDDDSYMIIRSGSNVKLTGIINYEKLFLIKNNVWICAEHLRSNGEYIFNSRREAIGRLKKCSNVVKLSPREIETIPLWDRTRPSTYFKDKDSLSENRTTNIHLFPKMFWKWIYRLGLIKL